jgi:thiol-disulfide isomerase/thioredoxin
VGACADAVLETRPATAEAAAAHFVTPAQLKENLASRKGRVVVVHLWATWCGPCVTELPMIAKLARAASSYGVDLVPVSLDDPTPRSAAFVARVLAAKTGDPHWSPILKADHIESVIADLDPRWEGAIPVFFAFDRDGHLHRTLVGNLGRGDFERLVADLLPPENP